MKKKIFLLIAAFILMLPFVANAAVKSDNLKELVEDEISIFSNSGDETLEALVQKLKKADLSKYEPSTDKVTVYFFRGATCSHCLDAAAFFASLYGEMGDMFDVVSYEVWNNQDNSAIAQEAASKLGETFEGAVPLIIIGEKIFPGYASQLDAEIKDTIKTYYEGDTYVDIVNGGEVTTKKKSNTALTVIVLVVTAGILIFIVLGRNTTYYDDDTKEEVKEVETAKKVVEEDQEVESAKKVKVKKTATKNVEKEAPAKKAAAKKTTAKKTTKKTK